MKENVKYSLLLYNFIGELFSSDTDYGRSNERKSPSITYKERIKSSRELEQL